MSTREQTKKRLSARNLIIIKGFSQKEAAKIVGVTEKTMCKWVKQYGWRDQETKGIKKQGGLSVVMEKFFIYVRSTSNELVIPIKKLWEGFLKSDQKDIGV